MCRQRTALEMIKIHPNHDGLSDSALLLHEKQCEDFEYMQKEINAIKEDISSVKHAQEEFMHTQEEMDKKIDDLISLVERKSSFSQNIKDILSNKVFLYILITLICAAFGVSVGEVGTFLFRP